MSGAFGVDGSNEGVVEHRDATRSPDARTEYTIRYADGGVLALGRRTAVMGVVNATPDSFSDGGRYLDPARAVETAARMVRDGAELIDVGGESTRPGAAPIDEAEEGRRGVPVISEIKRRLGVRVSVDTAKAAVARRAFDAGADMLNDVSALSDPAMLPLLREWRVPAVLMHMRGTPATMQRDTSYDDVVGSVIEFLRERLERVAAAGVERERILLDPGIGFGKDCSGNLTVLRRLGALRALDRPILIGASRKSFIGTVLDLPVDDRLEGSLAVAAVACAHGAHVIRAHDVGATVRVVRMVDAIHHA